VRWLLAGGDIYGLSKHLGHTSVKTTEIYLAYLPAYEERNRHIAGTMPPVSGDRRTA
jgi:integrase